MSIHISWFCQYFGINLWSMTIFPFRQMSSSVIASFSYSRLNNKWTNLLASSESFMALSLSRSKSWSHGIYPRQSYFSVDTYHIFEHLRMAFIKLNPENFVPSSKLDHSKVRQRPQQKHLSPLRKTRKCSHLLSWFNPR
jgi:hypothetical protein